MTEKLELLSRNKYEALDAYKTIALETSLDTVEDIRTKFLERFGPQVLGKASGRDLLDIVHGDGATKGMFYDLEFGSTAANYGGVAGGSALKFKVYRSTEGDFRRKGNGSAPAPCSEQEAMEITQALVNSLLRGLELVDQYHLGVGDPDLWKRFDDAVQKLDISWPGRTDSELPILYLGWAHKYLALVRPDLFSFHHLTRGLAQHLVRLGVIPEDTGRYLLDWQWSDIRSLDPEIGNTHPALWMKACYDAFGGNTNYWRIGTEEGGSENKIARWPAMRNGGFASVGWSFLGNMTELLEGLTGEAARERIKTLLKGKTGNPGRTAKEWLNFYEGMKPGDRIAAMQGQMLHGVGIIRGDYEYTPDDIQPHHRRVEWRAEPDEVWPGFPGYMTTLYEFSEKYYDAAKVEKYAATGEGLSGPPMHDPSLGLRPEPLVVTPSPSPLNPDGVDILETYERIPLTVMEQRIKDILDRKGQVILYGPPGTGKTYHARRTAQELISRDLCQGRAWASLTESEKHNVNQRIHFCTFHPAYSYEDFIEGYRPVLRNGAAAFELRSGLFRRACDAARAEPSIHHVLIIDEINRGNVPAILGELITLLEVDKRENLSLTLPLSSDSFTVPRNLWLIGTMNTADRSISLLDAALRRRFGFVELLPDISRLGVKIDDLSLAALLETINERIRRYVTRNARELQIGHAYFMRSGNAIKEKSELLQVLRDDVIPLICEYCFEDYRVVAKILGDDIIDAVLLAPAAHIVNDADAMYRAILSQVSSDASPTVAAAENAGTDLDDAGEDSDDDTIQEVA